MKQIKIFTAFTFAILCALFSSCEKEDLNVSCSDILGTWAEDYSSYPEFASEGGAYYTFKADGTVDIHYYDVFAGDHETSATFSVGQSDKNVIFIDYSDREDSFKSFQIVRLTKNEMEWQRIGTTFSKGTLSSDFKHFVRTSKN